jgi:hypothetical protein
LLGQHAVSRSAALALVHAGLLPPPASTAPFHSPRRAPWKRSLLATHLYSFLETGDTGDARFPALLALIPDHGRLP